MMVPSVKRYVIYLYDAGRRCVGYVGVDTRTYAMRERKRVFEGKVRELNGHLDSWVMDSDEHTIRQGLQQYLEMYPQTNGLLCFNDEVAADVLFLLSEMGKRVPDDIAVIGFDDVKLAQWVSPRLTTVRLKQSISELGELAANMLLGRIEGEVDHQPVILSHELVVRDSTP